MIGCKRICIEHHISWNIEDILHLSLTPELALTQFKSWPSRHLELEFDGICIEGLRNFLTGQAGIEKSKDLIPILCPI